MAEAARADAYNLFLHRSARASRRSRAAVRRDRVQAAPVLLRSRSLGDCAQAQVAGQPGPAVPAIRRSARHPADARAGTAQSLPFLPVVQAFLRPAAAPISCKSPNRTGQAAIGES